MAMFKTLTMTAQAFEKIVIDNNYYDLANEPLKGYLRENPKPFKISLTSLWRGYIGTWKIENNKLYLIDIEGSHVNGGNIGMDYLFDNTGAQFASWYSGKLNVPFGDIVEYIHRGHFSIYEKEYVYQVERGVIVNKKLFKHFDNESKTLVYEEDFKTPLKKSISNFKSCIGDKENYPFIKLPKTIEKLEEGIIEELEPLKLPKEPEKVDNGGYLFVFIILLLLVLSIYFEWLGSIFSFILFLVGAVVGYFTLKETIKKKEDFVRSKRDYEKTKSEIISENLKRRRVKEDLIQEGKIENFKAAKMKDFFNCETLKNVSFKALDSSIADSIRGRYDLNFMKIASKVFNGNIYNDLSFEVDDVNISYDYTPDMLYWDDKICIDIEIDEPYTIGKKPIHKKIDLKEIHRNSVFTDKNILVVRFSENQIALQPIQCAFFIATCIYYYTGNIDYAYGIINDYSFDLIIKKERRWDNTLVTKYIDENYREMTYRNSLNSETSIENIGK